MKLDFNCLPLAAHAQPLVCTWEPEAGAVDGPDAGLLRWMATWGQVQAHPLPWAWTLSAEPLRSWTDVAAIVGSKWHMPPELRDHYPQCPPHKPPSDESGEWLPGFCYEPRRPAAGK
jgi:hypothetical protein